MSTPADALRAAGLTVIDVRVDPRPYLWTPQGMIVHWTASRKGSINPVPSLNTVQYGRPGVPGPLYGWLHGRDGVWYWITDGYHNHAGSGNTSVLDLMANGAGPTSTAREMGLSDTDGGGNKRSLGVSMEYDGYGEEISPHRMDTWIRGLVALSQYYNWPPKHVISHATYTPRKVDWPAHMMMDFRNRMEAVVTAAQSIPLGPHGEQEARFNPPIRIDARWRDWCIIENHGADRDKWGTHGLVALGAQGDIYAFNTQYHGAPNR